MRLRGRPTGARRSCTAGDRRQSGAKKPCACSLAMGAAASGQPGPSADSACGERADSHRPARPSCGWRAPENAKGIPVISADDRFNLFSSHEKPDNQVWRFLRGNAQSRVTPASGGFGGARDAPELDPSGPAEERRALYRTRISRFSQSLRRRWENAADPEDTPRPRG